MDAAEFRESVETEKASQLDRLGSSKLLIALTDGDLDERSVLESAADSEHAARGTFSGWADDESNDAAREAFADAADQERRHLDLDAVELDGEYDLTDGGPMHSYLRGREATIERVAAGMVGRSLVSVRAHTQVISFFVNEADEARADLFRELKSDTRGTLDAGLELLDELCDDAEDWERAEMVAGYVIQVAYDDYVDALGELGVEPKSLC
ncbi:rubrerythrin family protein [Natronoarchaeum mannanilyticum]|uniref:rubrerythrin family protein n=1 Tax=Natronoarchaeum mannanilyticum TaxID=926360 RepID=UPI003607874C